MSGLPSVTVIVTTYERPALLPGAVASALAAGESVLEVLVLDDGSTDETPAVAAQLAADDSRVHVHRHENCGQAATTNRGFELARGDVTMLLCDDDLLAPGAADFVARALIDDAGAVAAYGDFELLDEQGGVIERFVPAAMSLRGLLLDHHNEIGPGAGVRTDVARRVGGWDVRLRHTPDADFWMRVGLHGGFAYVPHVLGGWRRHDGQITAAHADIACAVEHVEVIERFLERPDLPDELRASAAQARSSAYVTAAFLIDPDHAAPDRRFHTIDRLSAARVGDHPGGTLDAFDLIALAADERLRLIQELDGVAGERLRVIEELEGVAGERLGVIEDLEGVAGERLRVIEELESVAGERLALVEQLHSAAAERLGLIASLDAENGRLRAALAAATAEENGG